MFKEDEMRRRGMTAGGDRFRAIASYVHATHVILVLGTVTAPAVAFVVEPRPPIVVSLAMLSAVLVGIGASLLVAAEFVPHHRFTRWLRNPRARAWASAGALASALAVAALVPVTGHPVTAAAVPLAWALRAVSGGSFWSGIIRLLVATIASGLVMFAVDTASGHDWEPLTLIVAALLALGLLGQDSIYALAIELDDLRSREAERAVITERKRFAGDLHDIQGQHLGLITVEAELVSRLIERGEYLAAAQHAERVQAITLDALEEMHRVVHANREVRLDEEIANAVRVLLAAGITAQRDTTGISGIDDETDRLLGLTVREAITNILKHTRASTCTITTRQEHRSGRSGVALIVTDSGPSSAPSASVFSSAPHEQSGTGLQTLCERYRGLDGELEFAADDGGRLVGWLPVSHAMANGDTA
ncbi:sensor histidine kinase [Micromonospora sp. NPDC048063]|uniref:sensor histidine kinase n=1 Tax=Micromonospora sp. NPDC048063 TaxID=3364256 RepID=UPI003714F1E1